MTKLRNLASLPIICVAIGLYYAADWFAWLSKGAGDAATWVSGPDA